MRDGGRAECPRERELTLVVEVVLGAEDGHLVRQERLVAIFAPSFTMTGESGMTPLPHEAGVLAS